MTVYRSKSLIGTGLAIYKYTGSDDPLTDPTNHLADLLFHSTFDYYQAASGFPADATINHLSVAADTGTDVSNGSGLVISYTTVVEADYELATHGLGYKPNFLVSVNGVEYPAGCPIQVGSSGARRCVTFWVDTTKIYVRDSARPSIPGLPAISADYHVTVFRDPAPIGDKLEDCTARRIRLGYGSIDTDEHMAREPDSGETTYNAPVGETMQIKCGRPRFALPDGSIFDVGPLVGLNSYNGSFAGGPSKGIAI